MNVFWGGGLDTKVRGGGFAGKHIIQKPEPPRRNHTGGNE